MSLPYYKMFPAEHLGNYYEMSLPYEYLGIYYKLCTLQMWQHQGRIPDDPQYICSLLSITADKWEECRATFLKRNLVQVIDIHLTDARMRDKWCNAKEYSEEQGNKRKGQLQKRRERQILRGNK